MTRPQPVYEALLVMLDEAPRTTEELTRMVAARIGRTPRGSTVSAALSRMKSLGAAERTPEGWREPLDSLTRLDQRRRA